ncbi:hypothetical protein VN24_10495 [Paenibacillus beijingensis]|uniref:Uncharacterized protein n=1 Tax=Paenibacillus beijingensis TaxID=1126833 RepID=A0A0D5NHS7_9BACL|nr:hypothetical protein VN24_10495 [Paenibacillus beijingensis]
MSTKKRDVIVFGISSSLSALLFFLAYLFTLKYRGTSHGISGNGNLGLMFIFPAIPIYIVALIYTYRTSRQLPLGPGMTKLSLIGLTLLIVACTYGEYAMINRLLHHLGGGTNDPNSVIYRYSFLNQYTNKLFFNAYTFMTGLSFASVIAFVLRKGQKIR